MEQVERRSRDATLFLHYFFHSSLAAVVRQSCRMNKNHPACACCRFSPIRLGYAQGWLQEARYPRDSPQCSYNHIASIVTGIPTNVKGSQSASWLGGICLFTERPRRLNGCLIRGPSQSSKTWHVKHHIRIVPCQINCPYTTSVFPKHKHRLSQTTQASIQSSRVGPTSQRRIRQH